MKLKTLIIDDEPLPAKYLKELIKSSCNEVISCEIITNPILALQIVEEHKGTIDVSTSKDKTLCFKIRFFKSEV